MLPNISELYSCPLYKDCVGNGKAYKCSYAVKATKANQRIVLDFKPACFKTFRRKTEK